jgi:hypothetical protein
MTHSKLVQTDQDHSENHTVETASQSVSDPQNISQEEVSIKDQKKKDDGKLNDD